MVRVEYDSKANAMYIWLRKALTKHRVEPSDKSRRIRIHEEEPSERFVLIIALMIVFFIGLIALQIVHLFIISSWSEEIWILINTMVGTIIGSVWGYSSRGD